MTTNSFFDEPEEASLVKAAIVADYFNAWSRIMAGQAERIGYLDFYAGPGRFSTGEKSTPLLILERAIADPKLATRLVSFFNDADPDHVASLSNEIAQLPGIADLSFHPIIQTGEVNDDMADRFATLRTIPSLSFIDPWGYKGLSLRLIQAVIKDWGCEAIFFFNYNRINMGVTNRLVTLHMENLFGENLLQQLQEEIDGANPSERESLLRRRLGDALSAHGAAYLIPFRFMRTANRPSHYVCFVSKHPLGYTIMKQIMAGKGIVDEDGVPLFEYLPPHISGRQLAFDRERPLLALGPDLLKTYAGKTLSVEAVIAEHNIGTPFIPQNYKSVLLQLEAQGRISCDVPAAKRRMHKGVRTLADRILVNFPK